MPAQARPVGTLERLFGIPERGSSVPFVSPEVNPPMLPTSIGFVVHLALN
jgi:hypothetical protein